MLIGEYHSFCLRLFPVFYRYHWSRTVTSWRKHLSSYWGSRESPYKITEERSYSGGVVGQISWPSCSRSFLKWAFPHNTGVLLVLKNTDPRSKINVWLQRRSPTPCELFSHFLLETLFHWNKQIKHSEIQRPIQWKQSVHDGLVWCLKRRWEKNAKQAVSPS